MLRHLSPSPKRSTMTKSACPASLSSAASTEPINPPPPVTTIMRGPASGRVLLRPRPRGAAAGGGGRGADRLDQPRRRASLDEFDQQHPAAGRLHLLMPHDALDRVIAALDQHIRLQPANELDRGLLVEADDGIDRLDGGDDGR